MQLGWKLKQAASVSISRRLAAEVQTGAKTNFSDAIV